MAEAQLKQKNKKRVLSALSFVFLVVMIGAGAYAALGSVATVDNEISIGAVNISLEHYYQRDNVETKGTYNDEDITSVGAISSVPRITNLGIGSYIRLAVRYYDENLEEKEETFDDFASRMTVGRTLFEHRLTARYGIDDGTGSFGTG